MNIIKNMVTKMKINCFFENLKKRWLSWFLLFFAVGYFFIIIWMCIDHSILLWKFLRIQRTNTFIGVGAGICTGIFTGWILNHISEKQKSELEKKLHQETVKRDYILSLKKFHMSVHYLNFYLRNLDFFVLLNALLTVRENLNEVQMYKITKNEVLEDKLKELNNISNLLRFNIETINAKQRETEKFNSESINKLINEEANCYDGIIKSIIENNDYEICFKIN